MEKIMQVNERATLQHMKKQLEGLRIYCANMRLQSILYGEENSILQVEDEIGNYLNFSKSVIQIAKQKHHSREEPILHAMALQQRHHEIIQQQDAKAYIVLQGINQLQESTKELLLDVYVRQYHKTYIMEKNGGIVESTYHRRLHKAILELAQVLRCEIYQR